jgi:Arc/MetJ-type ribon-helix-helix transcriptional regulator
MTIHLKPEQERIIQEEIQSGHFRNPGELLDHALAALRERERKTSAPPKPRKSLIDVLTEPPFAGSELNLERQRDQPRPLNL